MSIFAAIKSLILADPAAATLVGSRITRSVLPRSPVFPAITIDGVSGTGWQGNSSRTLPMSGTIFQLSCWAETHTASVGLANVVAEGLHSYSGTVSGIVIGAILVQSSPDSRTSYDATTKLYMTPLDVRISY